MIRKAICNTAVLVILLLFCVNADSQKAPSFQTIRSGFINPPDSVRPGVYWYFMDGNLTESGVIEDLKAMRNAGIGHVIFLEVNVGVPRGKVDFLSEEWLDLFRTIVRNAENEGIDITLGIGPGWTGSGGPWVPAAESMQTLVGNTIQVSANGPERTKLPVPAAMKPFFGNSALTPELIKKRNEWYRDVAVLAFPSPHSDYKIDDIDNKALYYRSPYSSATNVKPFYAPVNKSEKIDEAAIIKGSSVIDITDKLGKDGLLNWRSPSGTWTVMRFVARNNGAGTRPAPVPGLGFESDKFDTTALNNHLEHYVGKILNKIGLPSGKSRGGLKNLHLDSWEMGAQNWTGKFREEFKRRRGYDPKSYYPVLTGSVVNSLEISDRFLWDLRKTSQELIIENHAEHVKRYASKRNMKVSIEPYDMNPTADLELGAVADIPMCEFWSKGMGFNTQFSVMEASSLGHLTGKPVVAAESFTAQNDEAWKQYPGSMKNQGDWAFAAGVNKFFYHTYQSQVLNDSLLPGMTMGPYGVQWNRNQTWWPMSDGYHRYISRCSYLLQQGNTVADILYLTPEEFPYVFVAPFSATKGDAAIRDRRGYNFDAAPPSLMYKASVQNGKIRFPGGASYQLLVLPDYLAMTPQLLNKIISLVRAGATVVGPPPQRAQGLSDYPASDAQIASLVKSSWGNLVGSKKITTRTLGKGKIIWAEELRSKMDNLYPHYDVIGSLIKSNGITEDFSSDKDLRYTHRSGSFGEIYFVSNTSSQQINAECSFRTRLKNIELWNPLTGTTTKINNYTAQKNRITITLPFDSYQSYFVIFSPDKVGTRSGVQGKSADELKTALFGGRVVDTLSGSWNVSFDPKLGGSATTSFDHLMDWTKHDEDGIKYYSGIANYTKTFDAPEIGRGKSSRIFLDLGEVKNLARIRLNGKDLGVLWTAPWRVDITDAVKEKNNKLEISVANLWINRLIGDQRYPNDGVKDGKWPEWIQKGEPRPSKKRVTFTTFNPYKKNDPLRESGLLGPVTLSVVDF